LLMAAGATAWSVVGFDDNFESYLDGGIFLGQNGWTMQGSGYAPPTVVSSPVSSGSRAARWQVPPGTSFDPQSEPNMERLMPIEWTTG
jgi:hypothetical protein